MASGKMKTPQMKWKEKLLVIYGDANKVQGILFRGDNNRVLPILTKHYKGQIKCIYIDPPYNTCKEGLGFFDGLTHNEWIQMMKPRLCLLWELIRDDGSLWISIDDTECHYLKVLCDKLFGSACFVGTIVREKNDAPRNLRHRITHMHDYMLVYSKTPELCTINDVPFDSLDRYAQKDENNEMWIPLTVEHCEDEAPNSGLHARDDNISENKKHEIKRYRSKYKSLPPTSLWLSDVVGSNQEARKEICELFHNEFFYTPKPERLLKYVIEVASNPGDIILDAFLGTGTTAAVAHKLSRKWIGIEIGNQCEEYCLPRMISVVNGDQGGISRSVNWNGGGGFAYYQDVDTRSDKQDIHVILKED